MKLQLTDAEITHLCKILAWMRCEYMLDENSQAGFAQGLKDCVNAGFTTEENAIKHLDAQAEKIKCVPQYVRHGIKMLTKTVHEHNGVKGDVVDAHMPTVARIEQQTGTTKE